MPDVERTEIEGKVSESGRLDGKVSYLAQEMPSCCSGQYSGAFRPRR